MRYGGLVVGDYQLDRLRDGVSNELLAIFRPDMFRTRSVASVEYWGEDVYDDSNNITTVRELACPGAEMIDRLDVAGCTLVRSLDFLQTAINDSRSLYERFASGEAPPELLGSYLIELSKHRDFDAKKWMSEFRRLGPPGKGDHRTFREPRRTSFWLLDMLSYWDPRFTLRLILEIFPELEVRLDMTEMVLDEEVQEDLAAECADATLSLRSLGSMSSPVVVLTEGRTDAQILSQALAILYPALVDLVRFMDYSDRKPEGGAGALVGMVRTFAGSGIANRIIAIFDNDSAAEDALSSLDPATLPSNIKVLRYPWLELASRYPALGPPSVERSGHDIDIADVNGLACSIELYLGEDVLRSKDGDLMPVQWRNYVSKLRRYHGTVLDKRALQDAFGRKVAAVCKDPANFVESDWSGLRSILDEIRRAIGTFSH